MPRGAAVCCAAALGVAARAEAAPSSAFVYVHNESYMGEDFFSRWNFWTKPDPTHGVVEFVDQVTAAKAGLINATKDRVYMGVDMTSKWEPVDGLTAGRKSVRIQSRQAYNSGLFVLSLDHLPAGCGTWPAFWMYGEDDSHLWPTWGEYDIIEAVHERNKVMTTLHTTGARCDQLHLRQGEDFAGTWDMAPSGNFAGQCDVNAPGQWHNQGCSQYGPIGSTGELFNSGGGGTYAAEWDTVGGHIRTWFFPAGSEPADLKRKAPDPNSWGKPYSLFTLSHSVCSSSHFMNMRLVFDLTFCGELGDPTFAAECPAFSARNLTCQDMVAMHPEALREAFWSIRSLDVYQLHLEEQAASVAGPTKTSEQTFVWDTWMNEVRPGSNTSTTGGKGLFVNEGAMSDTNGTGGGHGSGFRQWDSAEESSTKATTAVPTPPPLATLPPPPTLAPMPTLPPLPPMPTLAPPPTVPPLPGLPVMLSGLGLGEGAKSLMVKAKQRAVDTGSQGTALGPRALAVAPFVVAPFVTLVVLVALMPAAWGRLRRRRTQGFAPIQRGQETPLVPAGGLV